MDMSYVMSLLGFLTLARSFLPPELNEWIVKMWEKLIKPVNMFCVFHVPELESNCTNDLYRVVQLHMRAARLSKDADELVLSRDENEKEITFSLAAGEEVAETYQGVTVYWRHKTEKSRDNTSGEGEYEKSEFELKFRKRDKDFVMNKYLDYVTENAMEFRRQLRELSLYSNNDCYWENHSFKHPSNFDTLAMEPELKAKVKADLDSFMRGEKFFHKVGRAWKRGYLLYGPPGTGKSSMIAAIANYLKYNVYDLELTQVFNNNSLKQLLVNTTSKSIIVIEDIDCSLELSGQRKSGNGKKGGKPDSNDDSSESTSSVTLSGLLNFTDGLWSCCGDERIIIFTTNHVEKLDPALLRPGRMDMHIHMSYCSFETFKALAKNYLGLEHHTLYDTVKELLEGGKLITPAQVTEHLFGNRDDSDAAMKCLVEWLQKPTEETTKSEETTEPTPSTSTEDSAASAPTETTDVSNEQQSRLSILEEKVQSLEKNLQSNKNAELMSNGEVVQVENGDLHIESDGDS